mmetsp:Transcript_44921/g.128883  ORF Transcript_44921/g.128883 Transcript_44921/m.128883 type:complete len:204 (+) Transcript_44921:1332-1943(+)
MQRAVAPSPTVAGSCKLLDNKRGNLQVLQACCQHQPTLTAADDKNVGVILYFRGFAAAMHGMQLVAQRAPEANDLFVADELCHGREQAGASVEAFAIGRERHPRNATGCGRLHGQPARDNLPVGAGPILANDGFGIVQWGQHQFPNIGPGFLECRKDSAATLIGLNVPREQHKVSPLALGVEEALACDISRLDNLLKPRSPSS